MDEPFVYEIRVRGSLTDRWSGWFEGLTIRRDPNGEMVLRGPLADQAALHGVLAKIRDLNLALISVNRIPEREVGAEEEAKCKTNRLPST